MAAGAIFTVLSNIPWGQVVDNAPKLADGAAKLWNLIARKKAGTAPEVGAKVVVGAAPSDPEVLRQRLVAMEEHIVRLEEQMGASAELIKALAEQNTQLVNKIELNSVRLTRIAMGAAIVATGLLGAIVYLLLQA
ncbi:MAG: hypothetical protein IPG93_15305 [Burkholderiales bacterium]|nr:hypothetical protein [Burkholderiales bacterium]